MFSNRSAVTDSFIKQFIRCLPRPYLFHVSIPSSSFCDSIADYVVPPINAQDIFLFWITPIFWPTESGSR